MKKYSFIFFLLLAAFNVFSQNSKESTPVFSAYEDTLKGFGKIILKGKSEEERYNANREFSALLEKALNEESSYFYPFDSLVTIARLNAPDNSFKIFNWHVPKDDGTFEYFGFIQTNFKKNAVVYPLIDKSADIESPELKTLEPSKWYGAHYYQIIFQKKRGNKYYTLLGWDGNDRLTNKKIIDVIYFPGKGAPKFGANIFSMEKKSPRRIIFEYAKEASMSLKFHEAKKQIVFDHLSPSQSHLAGQYQYYGPDLSFDALEFKKGKWEYIKDIDARNSNGSKNKMFNIPQ